MEIIEQPIENLEGSSEPLTKKKPRSEKQIQAFQEALKKRQTNIIARKQDKEIKAAELLMNKAKKETTPAPVPIEMPTPKSSAKTIVHESESEEEIIIVKSKPKKKVKKIIIESSESESDSGSDGGNPPQQQYVQRQLYEEPERPAFNSYNYFV